MLNATKQPNAEQAAGLILVLALHAAVLWGLWSHRLIPTPQEAVILFVNFIAPPPPQAEAPPKREPRPTPPRPMENPQPRQLVAEAPVVSPVEPVAPAFIPAAVVEAPPTPKPAGPVALGSELSVTCPERSAPHYPPLSRRFGEEGKVVLRVELNEDGRVSVGACSQSSGFTRLDESALAAVKTWSCRPAKRDGQPVRAVALQPFNFVLQGN